MAGRLLEGSEMCMCCKKNQSTGPPSSNCSSALAAFQIVGARDWLVNTAGIPKEQVVGFRAPYLMFTPEQRDILAANGGGDGGTGACTNAELASLSRQRQMPGS